MSRGGFSRRAFLAGSASLLASARAGADDDGVTLKGAIVQGGFVVGRTRPGAKLSLDGRKLRLSPDGVFVLGFGRDAKPKAMLEIVHPDGRREQRPLAVAPRPWEIQRLDGLPPNQVTPDQKSLDRIAREQVKIDAARKRDTAETFFAQALVWPATGRISGVYGSQRILNGEPRAAHLGVDVAVVVGTPLVAPIPAIVSLAEPDLFYTGGTVILDHGHGVSTLYAHLSRLDVTVGQRLEQGAAFALSGATGRVTGPHLHWGANWFEVAIDPAQMVGPMPAPPAPPTPAPSTPAQPAKQAG